MIFLMIQKFIVVAVFVVGLVVVPADGVLANELDDFQRARNAYEAQEYALSATLFEALVDESNPGVHSRALLLESYKFLGASYLFLGRYTDAEKMFEALLRKEPSYKLDPLAFPAEVQKTFNLVQQRLAWERIQAEQAKRRAIQRKREEASKEIARKKEKLIRLADMAEYERVEKVNSRWIAMIPFGVGQFQNNHPNAGTFFAVSEGLLLTINIASFLVHQDLKGQNPSGEKRGEARFAEKAFRYANWVSLGLFAAFSVAGIIDAQVRYKHRFSWERRRELPDNLREVLQFEIAHGNPTIRF